MNTMEPISLSRSFVDTEGSISSRRGKVLSDNNCLPLKNILNNLSACLKGPSHFQLGGDVQPCSDSGVTVRVELIIQIPIIEKRRVPTAMELISRQKGQALYIKISLPGVESITMAGHDRGLFLVIGSNLDAVTMLRYLRSRIGASQLVELRTVKSSNIESSSPARFEGLSHFQLGGDVQPCSDSGVTVRVELIIQIPIIEKHRVLTTQTLALISRQTGVESVTISGGARSLLLVIGSNLDAVIMLRYLRSRIGASQLVELRTVKSSNIESSSPARFEISALQLIDDICAQTYSP